MRPMNHIQSSINVLNTGRSYSEGGQRVAWVVVDCSADRIKLVAFYDHDRMIEGTVTILGEVNDHKVMRLYDAGSYDHGGLYKLGADGQAIRTLLRDAVRDAVEG